MPNDPINDRYNPKSTTQDDWEKHYYYDIPDGEIFYLKNEKVDDNHAYRKHSDKEAKNTKMQTVHNVESNIIVYTRV